MLLRLRTLLVLLFGRGATLHEVSRRDDLWTLANSCLRFQLVFGAGCLVGSLSVESGVARVIVGGHFLDQVRLVLVIFSRVEGLRSLLLLQIQFVGGRVRIIRIWWQLRSRLRVLWRHLIEELCARILRKKLARRGQVLRALAHDHWLDVLR